MERGAHGEDHILVVSVIQAQQHQVPHVTPDGRHRCHHFIAAQRAPGYSSVAYSWRLAALREITRLFIICLHLMIGSTESDHHIIHHSFRPDDREITVSLQQIQITGLVISRRRLFCHPSVQVEVMCLSNYSTSFKTKRLTLWMPTDQLISQSQLMRVLPVFVLIIPLER